MRVFLIGLFLGLALAGCRQSAAERVPVPVSVGTLTAQLKAEGDRLLAAGDYNRAVVKYQAALNGAPNDVSLHFALAVGLSFLPRREETVEHFMFVARRGKPGSPEVVAALEWLGRAGELTDSAADTPPVPTATGPSPDKGKLSGNIRWHDIEPRGRMVRVSISLTGDDIENRDVRLGREFKIGRVFEFRDVPPGSYHVVAEVAGTKMWDLKVVVAAGKDNILDLTESNAAVPTDYTPPEG